MTLLEVLAAVAVVGIVFPVLVRVATQGIRAESDSRHQLEASLLIDEKLAEIEIAIASGDVPSYGESEEDLDDGYRLKRFVGFYQLPPELIERAVPAEPDVPSLFGGESEEQNLIRLIALRLVWEDAGREHFVTRTTLAYDQVAAAALAGALAAPGGGAGDSGIRSEAR